MRFLSLETLSIRPSSTMDIYVTDQNKPWQRLQLIPLTVSRQGLNQLKSKVDPRSPDFHDGWSDWLDKEVTSGTAFESGARGWRMAGRFCLWANWERVYKSLVSAINNARGGRDETIRMLEQHYDSQNIPRPDEELVQQTFRIYICGSLCGGTCSGTFWEVGYMAQEALLDAAINDSYVHGTFTVVDRSMVMSRKRSDVVCSMNCWAAMVEYDYWASGDHHYYIKHPLDDSTNFPPQPNDRGPYTFMNIISPSNDSGIRSVTWNGQDYDLSALHASISTSLYLDLVPQVRAYKDQQRAQYEITEEIGRRSKNGMYVQQIQSHGLSGFFYPKFMIATAAACHLSLALVDEWTKEGNLNQANKCAEGDWEEIYGTIRSQLLEVNEFNILTHTLEQVNTALSLASVNSAQAILSLLKNELTLPNVQGGNVNLIDALQPNGALHNHFLAEARKLKKQLLDAIQKKAERHTNEIAEGQWSSVEEIVKYLDLLPAFMQKTINELPVKVEPLSVPWPSLRGISLRFKDVCKDLWLSILMARAPVQRYYIERAIDNISEKLKQQIENIAGAVMRKICEEAHEEFLGENLVGGEYQQETASIRLQMRDRFNRLKNKVAPALQNRWNEIIRERDLGSMRMVTKKGVLAADAEELANVVKNKHRHINVYQEFLQDGMERISFNQFISKNAEEAEKLLLKYYQAECWRTAQPISILDELETDRYSNQTKLEVARGCIPWLQFPQGEVPNKGCDEPDMIIGPRHSKSRLVEMQNQLNAIDPKLPSFETIECTLDNMVIFYDEAAALSLEDWLIADDLDHLLRHGGRSEAQNQAHSPYANHYTHKIGALHYHPKLRKIIDELTFWVDIVDLFWEQLETQSFLNRDAKTRDVTYYYISRNGISEEVNLHADKDLGNFALVDEGQASLDFIERIKNVISLIGIEIVQAVINENLAKYETNLYKKKRFRELGDRLINTLFIEEIRSQQMETTRDTNLFSDSNIEQENYPHIE